MTVPVVTIEQLHGARLLAEVFQTYIWQFRQLALLAVPLTQDPLVLIPLLEHQPGDCLLALLSVVGVASDGNYTNPVRLEKLFRKSLLQAEAIVILSRNTSTFPICKMCLRNVQHAFRIIVTSTWQ